MNDKNLATDYSTNDVAFDYRCSRCNIRGVKLWRQYNTFFDYIELLCVDHALEDQKKDYAVNEDGTHDSEYGRSDQISGLIPAVPDEEGETFWGYTSVPEMGVQWWKRLPLYLAVKVRGVSVDSRVIDDQRPLRATGFPETVLRSEVDIQVAAETDRCAGIVQASIKDGEINRDRNRLLELIISEIRGAE